MAKKKKKPDLWNADERGAEGAYEFCLLWLPLIEKAYHLSPDEKTDLSAAIRWLNKRVSALKKKRFKKLNLRIEAEHRRKAAAKEKREIIANCKRLGIKHPWED